VTTDPWRGIAVVAMTVVALASLVQAHEQSPAAARQAAGSLRLSAEVAAPGSVIEARGWVAPRSRRRVVLQRRVRGSWTAVVAGESSRRGRYVLETTLPNVPSKVVRYRVKMPRSTVGDRVLRRRFTPTDTVRTTDLPTTPSPPPSPPPSPSPSTPPPTSPPPAPPTTGPAGPVVAAWEMDEPAGSTTMLDSSGHGHHGAIDRGAAAAGLVLNGAYFSWSARCRDCPPLATARVVQVPDSAALEIPDPTIRYALEFRFSTTSPYGNLMQKGQSNTAGGQIKVQDPIRLSCVFKGAAGQQMVARSTTPLNDGVWHTAACVHAASSTQLWVDGVLVARTTAGVGPLDNASSFVIGGKTECDQRSVGCDYYSGLMDWVRVSRG
jgi:Concanavalin A-like lectin/glucanases superfamily